MKEVEHVIEKYNSIPSDYKCPKEISPSKGSRDGVKVEERVELDIEDKEVNNLGKENGREDLSLLSLVSDSLETNNTESSLGTKNKLICDFPNSIDGNKEKIVMAGDYEGLVTSQSTICDLMQKVKLRGVGRPRKMLSQKNPFEIDNCKQLRRIKRNNNSQGWNGPFFSQSRGKMHRKSEEAKEILETAEALGLQLLKIKDETMEIVKDHILKGNL